MQDMEPDEFALEPKQRMRYWKRQVAQFGQRVPLEDVVREMGLGHIPFQAFAQLYRNKIEMGQPYYSNLEDGFAIEFGMKNDHKGACACSMLCCKTSRTAAHAAWHVWWCSSNWSTTWRSAPSWPR